MNRLQLELDRLYGLGATEAPHGTRVAVLEVLLPAGWDSLAPAWRGVQSDLDLPAPAIAVSGVDGLQLWFSLAAPTSPSAGARFLQGLRERYLPGVAAAQVRMFPGPAERPAAPSAEVGAQRWSAFITHDLASVFRDTPWLDIAPTDEGQAALLRALEPTRPAAFEAALKALGPVEAETPVDGGVLPPPASTETKGADLPHTGPARFLTGVMNDETAPLALRIEAAANLLRYARPA